ncbi:MAG: GtrA family protein [Proteobacteria bacterium]|nr:GtrA family protein [Pseudomonadota bacterium]NBP39584.1 GtrA family protein [Betaproteobacteria bacterium]NBQ79621.1 GtrA family protein [Betaproteobacteria bacterium]NBQ95982.1 GtrA family protein [Betaproteobacteria bacterium]NBT82473.1 GtrA family protein [Betaproteobacteria bacterium]
MTVVQVATYLSVGVISAAVDVVVLYALVELHLMLWLATLIGFFAGLGVNYALHSRFTFNVSYSSTAFLRFVSIAFLNYGLTLCFVLAFEYLSLSPVHGKLVSLPFIAANGYVISKYWVYR